MIVDYNALLDVDIQVIQPILMPQNYEIFAHTYINAEFESEKNPMTFKLEEKVTVGSLEVVAVGDPAIDVAMGNLAYNLWKRLETALKTDQFIVPLYGDSGDYIGFSTFYPERLSRYGSVNDIPRSRLAEGLYRLFVKWIQKFKDDPKR